MFDGFFGRALCGGGYVFEYSFPRYDLFGSPVVPVVGLEWFLNAVGACECVFGFECDVVMFRSPVNSRRDVSVDVVP